MIHQPQRSFGRLTVGAQDLTSGTIGSFFNSGDAAVRITGTGQSRLELVSTATNEATQIYFGDGDSSNVGRLLYAHDRDEFDFYLGGARYFRMKSNYISGSSTSTGSFGAGFFGGNVGVGIDVDMTSFDRVLHVGGTSTAIVRFTGTSYSNDGGYVGLNYGGIELWNKRNAYMRFGTNNTERFRIHGGDVGIRNANPRKITVDGILRYHNHKGGDHILKV